MLRCSVLPFLGFVAFAPLALAQTPVLVDFEDVVLNTHNYNGSSVSAYNGQSYINGLALAPSSAASNNGTFTSRGATFNANYTYLPAYSYGYSTAWYASNVYDPATVGSANQYAAYNVGTPGSGISTNGALGSANYGVANNGSAGSAYINLPAGYRPTSIAITNTTYAAHSMKNGDQFAKKFGGTSGNDPDYFKLTIIGKNGTTTTGTVDFYLADFRFADNALDYIVNRWTTVDISSLAGANRLEFDLNSSDVGQYGMNTPAYFAADNLLLTPVPEPGSLLVLGGVTVFALRLRRRQRSGSSASVAGSATIRTRSLPAPVEHIATGMHPLTAQPSASGGTSS